MKPLLTNIERRRLIILAIVLAVIVGVMAYRSRRADAVDTAVVVPAGYVPLDSLKSAGDSITQPVHRRKKKRDAARVTPRRSEPADRDRLDEPVRSSH